MINILIQRHFVEKQSLSSLAKEFKISRNTITKKFREIGRVPINYQNSIKFNQYVFDFVDSEVKAYWLGFIAADGYIGKVNEFEIGLSIKDKEHLEKFKEFIGHSCSIKEKKSNNSCILSFRNKYFINSLKSLGINNCKSLTLKFPSIDKKLISHFIRGYFDGDGCIHIRKQVKKYPLLVSILGTPMFLEEMRKYLPKINKLYKNKGSEKTLIYQTSGKKAKELLSYLYKDATVYLERKRNLFIAVLNRNI